MSRTIDSIYDFLTKSYTDEALNQGLTVDPTKWKKFDHKRLALFSTAIAGGVQDQLNDSLKADVEARLDQLAPLTPQWWKDKMLNLFEYDAVAVPIVKLNLSTFVPYYEFPNPAYRIIKYCSVTPGIKGTTLIKVSGVNKSVISGTALTAAQTFARIIGMTGMYYNIQSLVSDKIFAQIDVYYIGTYSSVIQTNVIAAINLYLDSMDYDGAFILSDLHKFIKSVPGVQSVVFNTILIRDNSGSFGSGTYLVQNNTTYIPKYQTNAGYIQLETTSGKGLNDFRVGSSGNLNLNLIPQ